MCFLEGIIELSVCKAFDEAVKAGTKAGKYVRQYRKYLAILETEWSSLQYLRGTIERRVHGARDRGEEIEDAVSRWQEDVGRIENEVQQLIGQVEARMHCFACSCPNIKWRYQLGKQAEEKTVAVNQLAAQGSRFDVVSHPRPPPPELEFPSAENYLHLDSRTPIFEAIVNALKDPEVKMIGVHGLGGVGKTTLVEKVAKNMLDDGTFKQVPLVAVSKDLNVKEIQKKLADRLNFALDATKDEKGRANELWHKFKNGEKYLVILDDIWEKVDLKAIGIPVMEGNIGCKVVLTSRKEDLLRIKMKADRSFPIAELLEAEAWDLFKKKVGNTIESLPEIDSLARQVCRKCKGLPVAINALGAALEDKPVYVWKNALEKLERYMITNIEGINQTVWASLKLSYDMLGSSDAKSCFLLCCLFLEDAEIPIDDLMRHCVANSLLSQNPHTLDEARNAVRTVVDALKSASLLSIDYHENVVKIHNVIRDVGISIAREEKAFLIDHGAHEWPRNSRNVTLYSAISLSFKCIKGLPNGLEYPQLLTFMVNNSELSDLEVPDNFFNGMIQLTVLTFTRMRMRRLPASLAKLANLRMLYLNECELDDIAILKEMKSNLEVLSLRGSSIKALPLEIGQLTGLGVLDLQNCDKLKMIPGGVISNLTSLEELYFPQNFDKWEATTDKQQVTSSRENVSLEELRRSLSIGKLTTLHIFIPDVMLLPKEDLIFGNLKGFKISVGNTFEPWEKFSGRCMLKLEHIDQLRNEFIPLVDKVEVLVLNEIEGLKKVFHDRGVGNRFLDLKYLKVTSCVEDLEYLLGESKSSVQSHGLHRLQPFNNLTMLIIKKCKSKYLFSPITVKGLVHLEELEVRSCKIMEGIVGFERRNDEDELTSDVKFSKLKQLKLEDLPNLSSFYAQKEKMETIMGSSSSCAQPLFSEKLKNLQRLSIRNCMKVVVMISDNSKEKEATKDNDTIRFPHLKTLNLHWLPNLKSFICSETQLLFSNKDAFPVLEEIDLDEDSEILRDGTYAKEAASGEPMQEHILLTFTESKQPRHRTNNKMADTSAAQARKGKDIQKIPWERLHITREKYRQTRLEQYKNYENIPQSGEGSEKDCKVTMKGDMYYEFRRNSKSVKSTILHFQLRNLVWATSKHDVYLMSRFSITHWSALTCNKTEVLNVSGHVAPCEKHPGSLLEGFTRTQVSTLAVKDRLLVAGGFQGELICKFGISNEIFFVFFLQHTSLSPDGKFRIIVGDNPEGMLVDSETGKMVASLVGHSDFSFASAWHPDGLTFATGNQDKTCRIWDARNLSKSVAALKGNLGAIRSIRYSSDGRFMAMAEPADFVHVFDAKSGYEKEQEIDFFGEISGISFSPDTESLFIGVCDRTYGGGLLEFGRRRNNSCPDSII
ncbi:hypothetical protein RHSIM_RhsimUnG0164800 [Rhododendron simsii]|uniref:AAA+ ATPase domain-containing protein n=1 Tax=Rhododendron simsii TaxID=118357 RepID=A0A834FUT3_RHOSS|nr:hypothetical protein RHSIM_RhsimUnG0164800 [Rhododendron simsii]